MSRKYLGQPFDIHTGGIDHIPVHHNNEIAPVRSRLWSSARGLLDAQRLHHRKDSQDGQVGWWFITLETLQGESVSPLATAIGS